MKNWPLALCVLAGFVVAARVVLWVLTRRREGRNRQAILGILTKQHAAMRAKGIEPRYDDDGNQL